jgi:predicted phage terminase large subunit-like protein
VILIEDTGLGTALISILKRKNLPVVAVTPEGDKKARLLRHISKFANGQVFLLKTATGRSVLEDELFAFPSGRRNDLVDALTQALGHARVHYLWTPKALDNYNRLLFSLAASRLS